ncbi:MAG: histone deacetylase family protein [Gammaproteobacteria bacterium]|nr:histone deacetylase family protein [Gammaproteobacteria bacterium]
MNTHSAAAALVAAGAVLAGVDSVLRDRARFAFCAVRPPGHHAEAAQAMGFCLFNNVAVGAAHALARGLTRVAILDFDVHYGNGSARIFAGDPRVLVCNSFQQQIYPYWHAENAPNCADAPLSAGDGGERFREAIERIWAPALARHAPELILVSAGFDAHADDPLAGLALLEDDFGWIGCRIRAWAQEYCGGRVVASLEGGYDLRALAASVEAFVRPFCTD